MSDVTNKLLGIYAAKQAAPMPQPDSKDEDQRWAYLQAAAVLHCFSVDNLVPLYPRAIHSQPRLLLYEDIVYSSGELFEGLFTLTLAVRREALARFTSRQAMWEAVQLNPGRQHTDLQKMWEDFLKTGFVPEINTLSYHQLAHVCQICSWLEGMTAMTAQLPDPVVVLDLYRRKSVLASIEHLSTNNFTGREKELSWFRAYTDTLYPPSGTPSFEKTQGDRWVKILIKPFLAIHGPGGIGKSALVAHLLEEYSFAQTTVRIPFAYLAFDQRTLRIETPFTLLVESTAQFELQFPGHKEDFAAFNDLVRNFRDIKGGVVDRSIAASTREDRISRILNTDEDLYKGFARLLDKISARTIGKKTVNSTVLLILDTFEEVQYRDRESLAGFWRMLATIRQNFPLFRVIIAGRGSIAEMGVDKDMLEEQPLLELSGNDRVTLLQRLGVTDDAVAEAVAKQVGGNPLSLRLAANVIKSDEQAATAKGIRQLVTRKWLFFQVDEQLIQGQLYQRILSHIHDEKVKKLAHPGMVLRIVHPEIVLYVLAPLCRIDIRDIEEAARLCDELKKEHALVRLNEEGMLQYRPEIRQAMIRLLQQDKFNEVRDLRRSAIDYYTGVPGLTARAEEMYHRLVLDEDEFWQLDQRWEKGIETSIIANLEEYPDRVKVWLASRMNLEVPREIFQNADIADWERNITRKVKSALTEMDTARALQLLGERTERSPASPLYALEGKAWLLQKALRQAWTILEKGVEQVAASNNRGRLAELFWLQSQVWLLQGNVLSADEVLDQAAETLKNAANPLPFMHILCHRLLIREKYLLFPPESAVALRLQLNNACGKLPQMDQNVLVISGPLVIQLTRSLLEKEFPATAKALTAYFSFKYGISPDMLTSENLQGLEEYRETWEVESDNYRSFESSS
jgi:hypothetical protein